MEHNNLFGLSEKDVDSFQRACTAKENGSLYEALAGFHQHEQMLLERKAQYEEDDDTWDTRN
jgi:hypothetical protein